MLTTLGSAQSRSTATRSCPPVLTWREGGRVDHGKLKEQRFGSQGSQGGRLRQNEPGSRGDAGEACSRDKSQEGGAPKRSARDRRQPEAPGRQTGTHPRRSSWKG